MVSFIMLRLAKLDTLYEMEVKLSVLPKKEKGIVRSEWSSLPFLLCEDLILHLNQKLQCLNTPRSFKNTHSNAVLNQRSPQDEILQLSCAFFSSLSASGVSCSSS